MVFKADTPVRLRADSTLLYIDRIDEENALAICRRLGSVGPEGEAIAYPLDLLRENVPRRPRHLAGAPESDGFSRLLCRIGLHRWKPWTATGRGTLGNVAVNLCDRCGSLQRSRREGRRETR